MTEAQFKHRTQQYALRVIRLVDALPQLLRAGTSVGANYRAACRGRSAADVIAKLGIVEEEADECLYWMELLIEARLCPAHRLSDLMREGEEILAMTVSSIKTLRAKRRDQADHRKTKIVNPEST